MYIVVFIFVNICAREGGRVTLWRDRGEGGGYRGITECVFRSVA